MSRSPFAARSVALTALSALTALLTALTSCDPGADEQRWRVDEPHLLAIVSEPAEAPPGGQVTVSPVALGPSGPVASDIRWDRCTQRKPLTELGPVDPACMRDDPAAIEPLGFSPTALLSMPPDACRLFGPDRPDPRPGEPAGRPVDPDPSGGYYAPLRAALGAQTVAGFVRLRCDLSSATQQAVIAFGRAYRPNVNPALAAVSLRVDGVSQNAPADGSPVTIARGAAVTLAASWVACPDADVCGDGVCTPGDDVAACADDCAPVRGCAGAEMYALYEPSSQQVSRRREQLRVSWFATAGALDDAATGPATDQDTAASNRWVAPSAPGEAWLALVLRDDRGGTGHRFVHVVIP